MKNFKKYIGLLALFSMGFLLIPGLTYACSKATTKTVAVPSKKQTEKKETKTRYSTQCCKENIHKNCSESTQRSCRCSTYASSCGLPLLIEVKEKTTFTEIEKQKFSFKQAYQPPACPSIWLPPKIN